MPSPDREILPRVAFDAQNAEAYEQQMGRWSRRLAPLLIRFGGIADGERVLDVGCGTGSLSFAVPQLADVAAVTGVDLGEPYIEYARAHNTDTRITFETADARQLPFEEDSFDRAFSLLVLQFVPDSGRAVAEMRRVVRPGGIIAAAVWDAFGGLPTNRMVWDIATVLDSGVKRQSRWHPLARPQGMATAWRAAGLQDVEETTLLIRMEFSSFDDFWSPFAAGEGPPGQFVAGLPEAARARLRDNVRAAFLFDEPDGPRSFACAAWACRGTVPA